MQDKQLGPPEIVATATLGMLGAGVLALHRDGGTSPAHGTVPPPLS